MQTGSDNPPANGTSTFWKIHSIDQKLHSKSKILSPKVSHVVYIIGSTENQCSVCYTLIEDFVVDNLGLGWRVRIIKL